MNLSQIAQALGRQGGKARAKNLTPAARRVIASQGGRARAHSIRIQKLINENFRYLQAIDELHPPPEVVRLKRFKKRLPGIYAS